MPGTRPPDRLERSLPVLVGAMSILVGAISTLRGGQLDVPDPLGAFMAFAGVFAIAVSIRPESRSLRSMAGGLVVVAYFGRSVDLIRHAVFDAHPQTAVYWYGITLGVTIYGLLACLIWVVWTRVIIPWGEILYQRRFNRES